MIAIQTIARTGLFAALFCTAQLAAAQASNWPERSVKIVMPFPAGGASDVLTRILADQLQSRLGQNFVVENPYCCPDR